MYKTLMKFLTLFLPSILVLALPVQAQEEEAGHQDGARTCINTRQIRRTVIVDDRNVLFYMNGGKVYHNILRQACNGLEREGRFSYHISGGQLCRLDAINVLYNGAWGLREGVSCSLGDFFEIDKETADAMREAPEETAEPAPLPLPEPEEIGSQEPTSDPTPDTPPEEPQP